MIHPVTTIRHRKTLPSWSGDGKTWIWYEGAKSALKELKEAALERFAGKVEVGLAEYLSESLNESRYYMAFVFTNREDAMIFKLSVV